VLVTTTALVVASSDGLELELDGYSELPVIADVVPIEFCVIVDEIGAASKLAEKLDVSGAYTGP